MQHALTDAFVRALAPPATGRVDVTDARCPGLNLRVSANGVRSWSFRFRDPATRAVSRLTLGTYPDLSLSEARQKALELRRQVAAGTNRIARRRQEQEDARTKTFGALAERYLREHAYRFKRSAAADERNLRLHVLPHWAERRYDSIQRRDVIDLCEGMVQAQKVTQANRVQALISGVFSFAVDADLLSTNPCHRLKKRGAENVGNRVLSDEELTLFWTGIVKPPVSPAVGLALRLVLLTGVRSGEAAGALLKEFQDLDDLERASWTIAPERSKNGRAHLVPLSPLALDVVREARALNGDDVYLFPSPSWDRGTIDSHALSVAMSRFARELREETEAAQNWRAKPPSPHDLRRTFATRLASLGVPGEDVSALLNHTPRGVTAVHYNLYSRAAEKRRALILWASALEALINPSE